MILFDLGQSGARAVIDGELHQISRGKRAGESVLESIEAAAALLPHGRAEVVALSLTGLFGEVGDPGQFHSLTARLWSAKKTVVIDDGLAGYCGAVGGDSGVALTLGGGVVAVGGLDGKYSHADGLGSIFGDEGSGYWLGVRGITRALATVDKREKDTDLNAFLSDAVQGYQELEVKNSVEAVSLAIRSAKDVLEAADAGIQSAIEIRNEGALRLSRTVVAAWIKAGGTTDGAPVIAVSGGLSKNANYVSKIAEELMREIPAAKFISPRGDNLDGARWIAENTSGDIAPLMKWSKG